MTFEGILHTSYVQDFFFKHTNEGWCHLVQKDGVALCRLLCLHKCAMRDQCDLALFSVTVGFPVTLLLLTCSSPLR